MKNFYNLFFKCVFAFAFVLGTHASFAQATFNVDINWNPGSWQQEVGYQIVDANNNVEYCEATFGSFPVSTTLSLETGTYSIYAWDTFGDGWNGGSIEVVYFGSSLGSFAHLSTGGFGTGGPNSCGTTLATGGTLLGTFEITEPACTIECPSPITVDSDPGQCSAFVTVPAPTTSVDCSSTPIIEPRLTGPVTFLGGTSLIDTPAEIQGAIPSVGDVTIKWFTFGDFDGDAPNEEFIIEGPDGVELVNTNVANDCLFFNGTVNIPMATWN
ncbi:MAG: hypothetical protein MK212_20875, partial [Saprospiraceae bacterium]|nr:hypothetical protein [Saprospiraceae bacterium]